MIQAGDSLELAPEPLEHMRAGVAAGGDCFERHPTVEAELAGAVDDAHAAPADESLELIAERDGRGVGTLRIGRAGAAQQGDPGVVRARDFQLFQADSAIGEVALDVVGESFVDRAAAEVGELSGGWVGVGRERGLRHSWEPCPDWEKPFGRGWPGQVTKRSEPKVAANQACAHGGEQHQTRLGGRLGDWQRVCTPQDRRRAFGCVSLKIVT